MSGGWREGNADRTTAWASESVAGCCMMNQSNTESVEVESEWGHLRPSSFGSPRLRLRVCVRTSRSAGQPSLKQSSGCEMDYCSRVSHHSLAQCFECCAFQVTTLACYKLQLQPSTVPATRLATSPSSSHTVGHHSQHAQCTALSLSQHSQCAITPNLRLTLH